MYVFRLEPFPLMQAARSSIAKSWQHARRLKFDQDVWWREQARRHATVKLARDKDGWRLAYYGKPTTGPFPTRLEAINWYIHGGR